MNEKTVPSTRFDSFTNAREQRQASHNVPAVRFKADDGSDFPDWEEKKLGDIATIVMGQSPDSKNYSEDPIGKVLVQGNADLKNGKVSPRIWTTESPKSAEPGSLLMTVRAPVGALAITDIPVALGRGVCAITGPEILYYQLAQVENNHYWDRVSAGSTFTAIDSNSIRALKLCCPSESEQKKIASLLSSVDETLTLCQRRLELLTRAKKALMQQIFSRKLRFTADDGSDFPDWEKKKLGDLFKISAGGDLKKNQSSPVKSQEFSYPVYANALVNKGFHSFANYYVITGESFTVTGRGDVGFAVPRHEQYVPIVRLLVCQPLHGENVDFFAALINQIHIFVESTGVPQLTVPQLSSLVVSVPSLPEQQKIASCLSSADALIDQARAELEQWQEVKKSLLQQMFV